MWCSPPSLPNIHTLAQMTNMTGSSMVTMPAKVKYLGLPHRTEEAFWIRKKISSRIQKKSSWLNWEPHKWLTCIVGTVGSSTGQRRTEDCQSETSSNWLYNNSEPQSTYFWLMHLCLFIFRLFHYLLKKSRSRKVSFDIVRLNEYITTHTHNMIQKFPAQMLDSEWLTVCEWSHIGPWDRPPRSHQSAACLQPGGRNGGDKAQLPSANCYNWVIKTDDVKWKPYFFPLPFFLSFFFNWLNIHLASIHIRRHDCDSPASWPWALCLASVFVLQQSLVKDGAMMQSQKGCCCCFFAHNVKSKQIGLSDEWTCLCPFGAGCPFVMPPLLRKQCQAHYCCQNHPLVHHHSADDDDDKPWNNNINFYRAGFQAQLWFESTFISVCYLHTGFTVVKLNREQRFGCFHPQPPLNSFVSWLLSFPIHIPPALWRSNGFTWQHIRFNWSQSQQTNK